MLSWEFPWLVYLLPLPLLLRWLLPARPAATDAIRVPFYASVSRLAGTAKSSTLSTLIRAIITFAIWAALLVAAAHPRWIGDPVNLPQEQRDLMLAVDISPSMQQDDMRVQGRYIMRIDAVKKMLGDFIKQRQSDRVGLILFAQQGYLQTPLTFDHQTVYTQLQEALLGFAGKVTAIGDAIGLAIKTLRDRPAQSRVLILLTDGSSNFGSPPLQAAKVAKQANIRIHTIGVGADSKRVKGFFGRDRTINPSADLDEKTLQAIADTTGGQYFRARNPDELQKIYAELDRLEPAPQEQTFRPTRSLSFVAIGIALILSLLLALGTAVARFSQQFGAPTRSNQPPAN